MRKSPEIGSGHHTTYFRELDGRIGRWWSTDPVIHAGMSPYSAFDGNPIYYVDPLGADSGCPDCSKEEIEHREANGQVWDEEYGGWTERAAIKKGKAGKHAKKRAAFIKYMISIDYTQADVNTYLKLKKKGNNPIVNNIESRIAEGRYEPIYDPNSPYADKWRASWNSGIYSSDYGRGVSSVVGTMGTIAVVAGPGLAIAASGMSANVAREIADEVVDQAWEASTGTPSPFITSFSDLAQTGVRRTLKKTVLSPPKVSISLGKGRGLKEFAEEVNAPSYHDWEKFGLYSRMQLSSRQGFDEVFGIVTNKVSISKGSIFFKLDGVNLRESSKLRGMGLYEGGNNSPFMRDMITEWELNTIMSNPGLRNRARFYRMGIEVPTGTVLKYYKP